MPPYKKFKCCECGTIFIKWMHTFEDFKIKELPCINCGGTSKEAKEEVDNE
jgi:hypothetical protein